MAFQSAVGDEELLADLALVVRLACVTQDVLFVRFVALEAFAACFALVALILAVRVQMFLQVPPVFETLVTLWTLMWLVLTVCPLMALQVRFGRKRFLTN